MDGLEMGKNMQRFILDGKEYAHTPLMAAVGGGHAEVVKFLITRKAKGDAPMIELLMSKGANHDARDKGGWTPLRYASKDGQIEAATCLLDHGADINAPTNKGFTPLLHSAEEGHLEFVKLLDFMDWTSWTDCS